MSASEFGQWLAFFDQEPIGQPALATMWGQLMAAVYNGPVGRMDKRPWGAVDFAPTPWRPPKEIKQTTAADVRAHVNALRVGTRRRRH